MTVANQSHKQGVRFSPLVTEKDVVWLVDRTRCGVCYTSWLKIWEIRGFATRVVC